MMTYDITFCEGRDCPRREKPRQRNLHIEDPDGLTRRMHLLMERNKPKPNRF